MEEIRKVAEKGEEERRGEWRKGELYYAQRSLVLTNSFCNIFTIFKVKKIGRNWGEIREKGGEIKKMRRRGRGEKGGEGELYYAQRCSVLTNSFCKISPFSK